MATAIHVNGPAIIQVSDAGFPGAVALSTLGITEGGPMINIEYHKEGVVADTGGPFIPVDYQKMGKSAKIQMAVVIYDTTVLAAYVEGNQTGAAEGQIPALGELMFGSGGGFRLVITSPYEARPWRFGYCSTDYCRLRPGTKYTIYDIGIDAIPYIGTAITSANTKLFDRVAA